MAGDWMRGEVPDVEGTLMNGVGALAFNTLGRT
jgi:hypothetical protein